ncbi:MAG TPA: calcium:proton antiporter [Gammaproteobacteria bacterium]|nr:calcium:proton antiporter [Gammaproteobacteria bacterium]
MDQLLEKPTGWRSWRGEWVLPVIFFIFVIGEVFKGPIGTSSIGAAGEIIAFVGFFGGALLGAFSVVRHAEELAHRFGEPYGTLILTISAITIEVVIIATIMLHGTNNPKFARDTMYSVVMIVLAGVVGFSLLSGGLRHHEQGYNLQGASTFLSVLLPLAVLSLVWPNFTRATATGELSLGKAWFIMLGSVALYVIFLGVQTVRHRGYFTVPAEAKPQAETAGGHPWSGWSFHAVMLVLCLLLVVLLAELFSLPLNVGLDQLELPRGVGAFAVAALILAPESVAAIRAAHANQMQRAINLSLGTVLATISLTAPAVLAIDLFTHHPVLLGLNPANAALMVLTLGVSIITFSSGRTNMLQGAVHLLLFIAYLVLIFSP